MTSAAQNLEYAERPPLRRRRAFRRVAFAMFLLVVIALGWWFGPAVCHEAQVWHRMSQCRDYAASADHVVCEEAPSWAGHTPPFLSAAPTPTPLAELERLASAKVLTTLGPVLYVHERTTTAGTRRLVVIRRVTPANRQSWDAPVAMMVTLWTPRPRPFAPLQFTTWHEFDQLPQAFEADQTTPSLRIFAGQTDPADPSRFTIGFETVDRMGTLEGQLQESNNLDEPLVSWTVK